MDREEGDVDAGEEEGMVKDGGGGISGEGEEEGLRLGVGGPSCRSASTSPRRECCEGKYGRSLCSRAFPASFSALRALRIRAICFLLSERDCLSAS